MSVTDPIADYLTRLRNANTALHEKVEVPSSRLKLEITKILKEEGFIKSYKVVEDNKQGILRINLKYGPDNERVISGLKRTSKPGLRVYVGKDEIPTVLGGLGMAILSTSQGVMTEKAARAAQVGGEVLCYVW
jgi:small subunit ribosomal protein S8